MRAQGRLICTQHFRRAHFGPHGAGYTVVLVDVCGFGDLGDAAGDAFGAFALPNRGVVASGPEHLMLTLTLIGCTGLYRVHLSTPVDLAFNVNRSIVAYHAGPHPLAVHASITTNVQ